MCVHKIVYLAWKNELDLIGLSISIVYHILIIVVLMNEWTNKQATQQWVDLGICIKVLLM